MPTLFTTTDALLMESLQIEPTYCTPHVFFDSSTGILSLSGCSYSEDAVEFYKPLFAWINDYKVNPQPKTEVKVYFKYFNTASAKCVYEIMSRLSSVQTEASAVKISWYHAHDDDDIRQAGIDFSEILKAPFEIIALEDEEDDDEQKKLIGGNLS